MMPLPDKYNQTTVKALKKNIDQAAARIDAARNNRAANNFEALLQIGTDIDQARRHAETALCFWAAAAGSAGASWRQIGDATGVHRQTAFMRWRNMMLEVPLTLDPQPESAPEQDSKTAD